MTFPEDPHGTVHGHRLGTISREGKRFQKSTINVKITSQITSNRSTSGNVERKGSASLRLRKPLGRLTRGVGREGKFRAPTLVPTRPTSQRDQGAHTSTCTMKQHLPGIPSNCPRGALHCLRVTARGLTLPLGSAQEAWRNSL